MNETQKDKLAALARDVFGGTEIFLAYAFGSQVTGRPGPWSDLDVGYYLRQSRGKRVLSIRKEMTLADRLATGVGLDIDLRNLDGAPLELRGRVLEEGFRIFCSDEVARVNLERDLLAQYHDYKDIFRQMHELRLRNVAFQGK